MVFPAFFHFSLNLAIRSSGSELQSVCFCWLYRASPSLAAKNIINLIFVLTIWWCPCVVSFLPSGRLPISISFSCSFGVLSCSFFWNILLCCLILCLWSPFYRLLDCSSCFSCLPLGGWGWFRALYRLPGGSDWCLPAGGWGWLLSLLWAGPCQRACLEVPVDSGQL